MIQPPPFSAIYFDQIHYATAEFLSEIKERFGLKQPSALLKEVVG